MNDNGMPIGGLDEYWETPQTMNTTWGYSKFDQQWKTPANVIQRLVEIISKGGNYLLNIGPTGDGTVPPPSVDTLKKVGEWMRVNGESIYGTSPCPLPEAPWGRCTVNGTRVYLHVFNWPADALLHVTGLRNEVRSAYVLARAGWKLAVTKENGVITVSLPASHVDDIDSVIVLELSDAPRSDPQIISQGSDSTFHLDYLNAVTTGKAVKRFNRDGLFHISKWDGPGDSASWNLLVSQAGNYKVRIHYSAPAEWSGARYVILVGKETLTATVQATGAGYHYAAFDLGTIPITKVGRYDVVVRPAANSNHNLMYFQALDLEPKI
jgi:alpha-L-fucosidase